MSRGYSTRSASGSGSSSSGKIPRSNSVPVPSPVTTVSSNSVQQSAPSSVTSTSASSTSTPQPQAPLQSKLPDHVMTTAIAPPRTFIDRLPKVLLPIKPYLELTRIDKPIGTWLLYWPCGMFTKRVFLDCVPASKLISSVLFTAWSITLSTLTMTPLPSPLLPLYNLALFLTGALVMRGAGCTINDMWDARLDRAVDRTKNRPLARGAISMRGASIFLVGQLLVGLAVLLQLNWYR